MKHSLKETVPVAGPVNTLELSLITEHRLRETETVAGPVSPPDLSLATDRGLAEKLPVADPVSPPDLFSGVSQRLYLWQILSVHLTSSAWSRREITCGRFVRQPDPSLATERCLAETLPVADPVSPPDLSLATERGLAQTSRPPVGITLK